MACSVERLGRKPLLRSWNFASQIGSRTWIVVDIDIEGFFDNVNHAKLRKQMWTLGIQDKSLRIALFSFPLFLPPFGL